MTFKPAHKESSPEHRPGQVVNPLPAGHGFTDKTLADYIARKRRQDAFDTVAKEKKLTFEEWLLQYSGRDIYYHRMYSYSTQMLEDCWKAAQENT